MTGCSGAHKTLGSRLQWQNIADKDRDSVNNVDKTRGTEYSNEKGHDKTDQGGTEKSRAEGRGKCQSLI